MATGLPAVGAKLRRGTSTATPLPVPGSDTFTDVPLVNNLQAPEAKRKVNSYATLDNASPVQYGGVLEARKVSFEMVVDFDDAVHRTIISDSENAAQVKRNWKIVYPNTAAETLDFVGFISSYAEEPMDAEGIVRAKVEISVDGVVTRTP